jgi:putative hydrolase of the HAD superfamily
VSAPLRADAVLFDIDDTLVDFTGAAELALAEAVNRHLKIDSGALMDVWHRLNDREYGRFLTGELDFAQMRHARMAAVLGELDPDRALRWDPVEVENHRNSVIFDHYRLFPDARACLDRLTAAGLAIGVVTNSDGDYQRRKLRVVGLTEYVDTAVCSGDVGVSKPDPAIFRLACEQLGVQPGRTVYVGDRWFTDAVGALQAGLGAVWLNRHGRARPERPTHAEDGLVADGDPTLGRQFAEITGLEQLAVVPV